MSAEPIDLHAIAPQAWKNGAGLTREVAFGGTNSTDFDWRISLAEVARDAPFSAFPGIDRCIVLLGGAGMRLRSANAAIDHVLTMPFVPFRFPGDVAVDATLVSGASSDLNVMARRGVFRSAVHCERSAGDVIGGDVTMLLCVSGEWRIDGSDVEGDANDNGAVSTLQPMHALLWRQPIVQLRIEPLDDAAPAMLVVRLCHDHPP